MEPDFWHERWRTRSTAFHEGRPNAHLVRHAARLGLAPGARVFVPLCGKSHDVHWWLGEGFQVVGVELSGIAVGELFAELGVDGTPVEEGSLRRWSAPGLDVLEGDLFAVDAATLGRVDAIYDRAAVVALPPDLRARYADHLRQLAGGVPQLVLTYAYDQTKAQGPPFSVPAEELAALYAHSHTLERLDEAAVEGGLRGTPATETVWLLRPR